MNHNIMAARRTRDSIDKSNNMAEYQLWRNRTSCLIHNTKKEFYSQSINDNYKNPTCLWQNLHDDTHKSLKQQTNFIHDNHGHPILDPETSANHFNEFFTSLYKDLNPDDTRQTTICTKLKEVTTVACGRVVKSADSSLPHLIIQPSHCCVWCGTGSNPIHGTCETSQVLLAGVPGGLSWCSPVFAPPTDWPVSYVELK